MKRPRARLEGALRRRIGRLTGLTEGASRVGDPRNVAWFAGGRELAHIHRGGTLDVRLPAARRRALRDDARALFRKGGSEWVEFLVSGPADIEDAVSLVRQAKAGLRRTRGAKKPARRRGGKP